MTYSVVRSEASDRDLEIIFDFLFEAALSYGEDVATAYQRASKRIFEIEDAMEALGEVPHQGTLHPDFSDGLRSVTKGRAIFYFDVDDTRQLVRVLAIFFGGQDHQRRMLLRLLSSTDRLRQQTI
ncbi:type II toxin-antitoxin system RelE/ParE family toxin [Roseovarius sp. CAU 1744]|uniref:type II toxin-antitoxin system RelE/ParE family toxin n=1 Tax=Roseovarius sp. CAU 1744 TaxID=3140368 RepID=UPI00325BA523